MAYLQQAQPIQIERVSQLSSKTPPKMQCGEHKTFQDKNNRFFTATAWKDTGKFPVKFLSTLSQPTVATHCVRRVGSSRQRIPQPLVAHQYNHSYRFIDMFDLYRSKYKVGRNSKKAWKKKHLKCHHRLVAKNLIMSNN